MHKPCRVGNLEGQKHLTDDAEGLTPFKAFLPREVSIEGLPQEALHDAEEPAVGSLANVVDGHEALVR